MNILIISFRHVYVYDSSGKSIVNIYSNSNGCDSTHTLNLTINSSDSSFVNVEACD